MDSNLSRHSSSLILGGSVYLSELQSTRLRYLDRLNETDYTYRNNSCLSNQMTSTDHIYDTSSIDNATAYKIGHTSRLLRYSLKQFFQKEGLEISPEQWTILFRLYEHPGQAQNQLADQTLNDHPNITRLIDRLVRQNFVKRENDPNDRRRSLIFLTSEGEELMETLLPKAIKMRKQIFSGITNNEINEFVEILKRIDENIMKQL